VGSFTPDVRIPMRAMGCTSIQYSDLDLDAVSNV
jgi:hypothetical protein